MLSAQHRLVDGINMWVDDQGMCHTVALADPTELMSDIFRQSFGRLMARDQVDLGDVLEAEQMRFFEERAVSPLRDSDETLFVAAVPPLTLLVEPVETVDDLRKLLRGIDGRWRLDALLALDDYLS